MRNESTKRLLSYGTNSVVFTLAIFGIVLVGYYIVDRELSFQMDWTAARTHTLSDKTKDLLERVRTDDRPITAYYFQVPTTGENAKDAFFTNQKVEDLLRTYEVASRGQVRYKLIDYLQEPLQVREYNAQPGTTVFERIVQEKPQRRVVPVEELVDPPRTRNAQPKFKGEQAFTTALAKLMDEEQRTVCFTTGHDEPPLDAPAGEGMSRIKDQLGLENYEPQTIDLLSNVRPTESESVSVPEECLVVVLAGPKEPFTDAEIEALWKHYERGRGLVVLVDPFTQSGIGALTERLGVEIEPGIVFDVSAVQEPVNVVPQYEPHAVTNRLKDRNIRIVMRQASALRVLPTHAETPRAILSSTPRASAFQRDGGAELHGPFALATASSSADHGRAVIVGDRDIVLNSWIFKGAGNADFFLNAVHWTAGEEEKITIVPKNPDIRTLDLTVQEGYVVLGLTAGVLPLCIALLGGFVWFRRRTKV